VGQREDGSLVYFVLPDTIYGAMAEQTVIDLRRSVPLPAGADPIALAAAMNPGMSSWVALRRRIDFQRGQSVLILGATGSAGQLAIQIAKHLGARSVIAAGRDAEKLAALGDLGADQTVALTGPTDEVAANLGAAAADVDLVLDYLWGQPTEQAIMPLLTHRADRSKPLLWVQLGSVAGENITLPSAVLRQANIQFLGSGQGSVTAAGIVATLPALAQAITDGTFRIDAITRPLAEVEAIRNAPIGSSQRVALVPSRWLSYEPTMRFVRGATDDHLPPPGPATPNRAGSYGASAASGSPLRIDAASSSPVIGAQITPSRRWPAATQRPS
jgi:NADPH:quinone reductase-like Zn-dependent oxidoreductase